VLVSDNRRNASLADTSSNKTPPEDRVSVSFGTSRWKAVTSTDRRRCDVSVVTTQYPDWVPAVSTLSARLSSRRSVRALLALTGDLHRAGGLHPLVM